MKKKMYVGTYSDAVLSARITKKDERFANDPEEVKRIIARGTDDAIGIFFADNLIGAKKAAKQMGLKNFRPVSNAHYQAGKDY